MTPAGKLLIAERLAAPARWRAKVRRALRSTGSVGPAAEALGVSRELLRRWVVADATLVDGIALRGAGRPKAAT